MPVFRRPVNSFNFGHKYLNEHTEGGEHTKALISRLRTGALSSVAFYWQTNKQKISPDLRDEKIDSSSCWEEAKLHCKRPRYKRQKHCSHLCNGPSTLLSLSLSLLFFRGLEMGERGYRSMPSFRSHERTQVQPWARARLPGLVTHPVFTCHPCPILHPLTLQCCFS